MLATIALIAGQAGFGYFALLLLTAVPGFPLGFALFGKRHFVSLLTGGALGYAITSLAWWAVVFFRHPSTWAYARRVGCRHTRLVGPCARDSIAAGRVAPVDRGHSVALMLVLLLVPALVARPFAKLGSSIATGITCIARISSPTSSGTPH